MVDRLWGNHPTDEDMPFAIGNTAVYSGVSVANLTNGTVAAGTFTMPWAGSMTVTATAAYSWPIESHQQVTLHLNASSPPPSSYSVMHQIALNRFSDLRGQLPMYATWANLVKGQQVNFYVTLGVGGGGATVLLEWISLTARAWPG